MTAPTPQAATQPSAAPTQRGPRQGQGGYDHRGFVRDLFATGNFDDLEDWGNSDRERQAQRLEAAIDNLAQARFNLWSGAGNPNEHEIQLLDAQRYLDEAFNVTRENDGVDERNAIIARFRVMEAVADRQVAIAGQANPERAAERAPGRIMRSLRWLRRTSPWIGGLLVAAGITLTAVTGGLATVPAAVLAAAPYAATAASVAGGIAAIPGAVAGNRIAARERAARNNAAQTRRRTNDELAQMHELMRINLEEREDGPSYDVFSLSTNDVMYDTAMGERQYNNDARRRAMLAGAGRAAMAAGWRAGLVGLGVGLFVPAVGGMIGGESSAAAPPTTGSDGTTPPLGVDRISELNPADTGAHQYQYTHLNRINSGNFQASYADFHNGFDALKGNGFGGDIVHGSGNSYWIQGAKTPDAGAWMYYQGEVTHIPGGAYLGNESLADLLHAANNGAKFFPGDTAVDQILGVTSPDGATASVANVPADGFEVTTQIREAANNITNSIRDQVEAVYGSAALGDLTDTAVETATVGMEQLEEVVRNAVRQVVESGALQGVPRSSYPVIVEWAHNTLPAIPPEVIAAEIERLNRQTLALAA